MFLVEKQQGMSDEIPVSSIRAEKKISAVAEKRRPDLHSDRSSFSVRKD